MIHVTETPAFITAARDLGSVQARIQGDGSASSQDVRELAELFPEVELVGNGVESIVIVLPGDEKKVVSFSRNESESAREFKEKYYTHRILSILFPQTFPKIYAAGKLKDGSGVSVRERYFFSAEADGQFPRLLQIQKRMQSALIPNSFRSAFSQMEDIRTLLKSNGLLLDFDSSWRGNSLKTKTGTIVYLDLAKFGSEGVKKMPFKRFSDFLSNAECDSMRGYPLSDQEKRTCEHAFFRLKVLAESISLISDFIAANVPVDHNKIVFEATHIVDKLLKEKDNLGIHRETLLRDVTMLVKNDTTFHNYFSVDANGVFIPKPSRY